MSEKFLTRRGIIELAKSLGLPATKSMIDKDSHLGRGPVPYGKFGIQLIYTPEESERYLRERIAPKEANAA